MQEVGKELTPVDRDLRQEVAEGLLYAHSRLNANTGKTLEAASFLYALVELLSDSVEVCPAFDDLFFPILRRVLLEDGEIGQDEQYMLLKMLYADGHVRESEREFLRELRRDATNVTPQFDTLCEIAFDAHPTEWDLGGR